MKAHKEKQRSINRLACTIQELTITLEMFYRSGTKKKKKKKLQSLL